MLLVLSACVLENSVVQGYGNARGLRDMKHRTPATNDPQHDTQDAQNTTLRTSLISNPHGEYSGVSYRWLKLFATSKTRN